MVTVEVFSMVTTLDKRIAIKKYLILSLETKIFVESDWLIDTLLSLGDSGEIYVIGKQLMHSDYTVTRAVLTVSFSFDKVLGTR